MAFIEEGSENTSKKNTGKPEQEKVTEKNQAELIEKLRAELAEAKKSSTLGLAGDQLEQILSRTLSSVAKTQKGDADYDAPIDMEQLDPDDYLDEPVKFSAPFVYFPIVEDIKQGRRIKLPNNKKMILFEFAATRYIKDGNYMRQNNISRYFSRSKKEVAFLRNHWQYGVMFYESDSAAMSADGIRLMKLSGIFQGLQAMEPTKIFQIARQHGVSHNDDINITRVALANKMVDQQIEAERVYTTQILTGTKNEELVYDKLTK